MGRIKSTGEKNIPRKRKSKKDKKAECLRKDAELSAEKGDSDQRTYSGRSFQPDLSDYRKRKKDKKYSRGVYRVRTIRNILNAEIKQEG